MRSRANLWRVALATAPLLLLAGVGSLPAVAAAPSCFGKAATIVGTAGDDTISGGGRRRPPRRQRDEQAGRRRGQRQPGRREGLRRRGGIYDTVLVSDLPATTPVNADLSAGRAVAGGVTHSLSGIEGVVGTPGNDTISGGGGFGYAGFLTQGSTPTSPPVGPPARAPTGWWPSRACWVATTARR